jgi:succinate dehydrogenase / fumarate reductase iron-sulfur subunit
MCSLYINGEAHGPDRRVTTCQLHMRMFKDGDTIHIEPFRAKAFPIIKDLVVDRSAFDRVQHAGGFISVNTSGNTQDANSIPISKHAADKAMVQQMDDEGFGNCTNTGACEVECPKGISLENIARMNREYLSASFKG